MYSVLSSMGLGLMLNMLYVMYIGNRTEVDERTNDSNMFELKIAQLQTWSANLHGEWSNDWTTDKATMDCCIVRPSAIDKSPSIDNLSTTKDDQLGNGRFWLQTRGCMLVDLVRSIEDGIWSLTTVIVLALLNSTQIVR